MLNCTDVLMMLSLARIPATRCALNACTRNSSPTLKTLTVLSTCVHLMTSRRLHNDPGCAGLPQDIEKTTLRHSQRKWKSPEVEGGYRSIL